MYREVWNSQDRQRHMSKIGTTYGRANAARSIPSGGFWRVADLPLAARTKYQQNLAKVRSEK